MVLSREPSCLNTYEFMPMVLIDPKIVDSANLVPALINYVVIDQSLFWFVAARLSFRSRLCRILRFLCAFDFDIFLANLFRNGLSLGFYFFAHTHFFFDASFLLHHRFLTPQRNENVLRFEARFSGLRARGRNTFNHDFFAFQFNGLLHGFGANNFSQSNAASRNFTFTHFHLFFAELDVRFFVRRSLLSRLWRRLELLRLQAVIAIDLLVVGVTQIGVCIKTRRVFYFVLAEWETNGSTFVIHIGGVD